MESILNIVNNKNKIKRFLFVVLGVFIAAVSFNLFIFPNDIVFGGLTGVSVIITNFIDLDPSLIIFVLSFILLLIGAIFLGRDPVIKAFVVAIVFPIFVKLTENVSNLIKIDTGDQLLLALFGGVMYGFGVGLVFKNGYTMGGTDILNQILHKYLKISMGNAMLIVDGSIVIVGALIFGWTKCLYAIIILYIISISVDKSMLGISDKKAFYIVTSEVDRISSFVIDELGHGVTVFDARGAYSNVKTKVLFTLIPTKEYYRFKEGIKTIDKEAFFTVLDAYEVLGGE